MSTRSRALLGAAALALAAGAAVIVLATGSNEPGTGSAGPQPATDATKPTPASGGPISEAVFNRVRRAAIDAAGGGELTEIHRSDDPGEAYEVSVRRRGREVEFALDDELQRVPDRGRPTDD